VSGDTSCADHNIAWRTRRTLGLEWIAGGVSARGKKAGIDEVSAISASLPATPKE